MSLPKDVNILRDIAANYTEPSLISAEAKEQGDKEKIILAYYFKSRPLVCDPDEQFLHWIQSFEAKISVVKQPVSQSIKTVE